MGRLIKYELKGNYKKYFILFGSFIIINFFLLAKISLDGVPNDLVVAEIFVLIFSNFVALIAILSFSDRSFKRELEQDTGYLTFTLPVKAHSIIGAKLIVAFIGYIVSTLLLVVFGLIFWNLIKTSIPNGNIFDYKFILSFIPSQIAQMFFYGMFILGIYFCTALTKSIIKTKKVNGFLTFIVFIVGLILVQYVNTKLAQMFPQTIFNNLNNQAIFKALGDTFKFFNSGINIASFIYSIVLFIGLFFGTSYLVENKVNI